MANTPFKGICEAKRGGEIYMIPPDMINIVPGWNDRVDFSGEKELMAFIKSNGVPGALKVRKVIDESGARFDLIAGERRLRAVRRLIDEGVEIKRVPVITAKKGVNEAELHFENLSSNEGKPFTPTEEASAYQRLTRYGWTVQEIAQRTGKSIGHIRNRLELSAASQDVKEAVLDGKITIGKAQHIAKTSGGDLDQQAVALKSALAKPKQRKLVITLNKGSIRRTGRKELSCVPVEEVLRDPDFQSRVEAAGFKNIRISMDKI